MRKMALYNLGCTALAALLAFSSVANAQPAVSDDNPGFAPLFADHSTLSVTIEAPLTTLRTERPEEEYLDGTFSFADIDGTAHTLDLKIRSRGNFRLQEDTCDFPPIRLNFRKKQVEDTLFDGQDKLKLVTHCRNGTVYFEQLLLREYLAYRFLQVLTDKSFSVRLLQINYVDTEGAKPITKVGFVIEDNDDVAERLGMKSIESGDISRDDLDSSQANLVSVFQFLIGNTDFSLIKVAPGRDCCHNSELMSATGDAPFTPVPYDFDFSGMVNAPYASSNPRFKLRNIRQRLYRGACKNNDLLPATLQLFIEKKSAIYGILDETDLFKSRSQRDVRTYLDSFYDSISQPKLVDSRLIGKCTGPT